MSTSEDRWTCPHPGCGRTVVIHGSQEDVRTSIIACQRRHAAEHRQAAEVFERLAAKWPKETKPRTRKRPAA